MKKYFIIVLSVIFFNTLHLSAQNIEKADSLMRKGLELLNAGNYNESINYFEKAELIDTENLVIKYEKALAFYKLHDYEQTIEILTPLKNKKDVFEQIYQLLGNSYDFLAKKEKAISIYNEGLKIFPNSGRLYMELGIAEMGNENNDLAISYFERGIVVEYDYPNNYYQLSNLLYDEGNKIYSLLYAETFLNFVTNQDKFREINKKVYKLYNEIFDNKNDTLIVRNLLRLKKDKFIQEYSKVLKKSFVELYGNKDKELNIKEIHTLRKHFIENWFSSHSENFQSKILLRHKTLSEKSLFETYDYWLMSDGNLDEFKSWMMENYKSYDKLLIWLSENQMLITSPLDIIPDK